MDQIKILMETQLTERELLIFLLVESGMSYRDLGKRLMTNHSNILRTYESARAKMDKMANAGLFSTKVQISTEVKSSK